MNQKPTALVTINLQVRYKFDLIKALKWLVPAVIAALKLPSVLNLAGP